MKNRMQVEFGQMPAKCLIFSYPSYGKSDNSLFTGFLSIKNMHTATAQVNTQ